MATTIYNPKGGGALRCIDNEYTENNRLLFEAGIEKAVPNNKSTAQELIYEPRVKEWIDELGVINPPNNNNDTYVFRVFGIFRFAVANTQAKARIDIGDGTNNIIIYPKSLNFNAGAGVDFEEAFEFTIYTGPTFKGNGGKLYLEFSEDTEMHGIEFLLANINKGR